MISVVYGVPGSGKSYYSVWFIKRRCLEEGDIFLRVRQDVLLITNLKLNLDDTRNYIYIEDIKDFAKYMDVDFWRSNFVWLQGRKVYIVMDEAQLFFYHFKDDPRVMFFLQYHRHLSIDILLITQTPKSLPAKVFELAEFLIESVPRSVNPFSFRAFRYRVLHPFDRDVVLRRFHLAFDPIVFHLYSDMIYKPPEGEEEKPINAFTRYYVLLGSLLLLTVFLMFSFFSRVFSPSSTKQLTQTQTQSQSQSQSQSMPVFDYEDLITEEKPKEKPTGKPITEEKPKEDIPIPFGGSYRIVATKPADSPKNQEDPLKPEPKIIYLP